MKCIGTGYENRDKEAEYIRHTQFSGNHPLCDKHAKEDKNFLVNDSYMGWEKLESEQHR